MKTRFLVLSAVLSVFLLIGCGEKTADTTGGGANAEAKSVSDETAPDAQTGDSAGYAVTKDAALKQELDEIAAEPLRLYAERGVPRATIAANGDFAIGGKAVEVDAAQRARLLAYRAQMVAIAQAGAELSTRTTGVVTEKIGAAIGKVLDGEKPTTMKGELKAEAKQLDAVAQRICAAMPALVREQNALAAAVPKFQAYAAFAQADADTCQGSGVTDPKSGEKIGHAIGAAIGNPFRGGMVAGYMGAEADKAAEAARHGAANPTDVGTAAPAQAPAQTTPPAQ